MTKLVRANELAEEEFRHYIRQYESEWSHIFPAAGHVLRAPRQVRVREKAALPQTGVKLSRSYAEAPRPSTSVAASPRLQLAFARGC